EQFLVTASSRGPRLVSLAETVFSTWLFRADRSGELDLWKGIGSACNRDQRGVRVAYGFGGLLGGEAMVWCGRGYRCRGSDWIQPISNRVLAICADRHRVHVFLPGFPGVDRYLPGKEGTDLGYCRRPGHRRDVEHEIPRLDLASIGVRGCSDKSN